MFGSTAVLILQTLDHNLSYGKPTHTGPYYYSTATIPYTTNWLLLETCTTTLKNHLNLNFTNKTLTLNGFPVSFLNLLSTSKIDKPANTQLKFVFFLFTTLPYVKGVSDKIKRMLLETSVKVTFKLFLTIGRFLSSLKNQMNHDEQSSFVYVVPCQVMLLFILDKSNGISIQNNGTSSSNKISTAREINILSAFDGK